MRIKIERAFYSQHLSVDAASRDTVQASFLVAFCLHRRRLVPIVFMVSSSTLYTCQTITAADGGFRTQMTSSDRKRTVGFRLGMLNLLDLISPYSAQDRQRAGNIGGLALSRVEPEGYDRSVERKDGTK